MKLMRVFFFLFAVISSAQQPQDGELKGKITSSVSGLDGIYVVNTTTEAYTTTTTGGYFEISARPGDSLMFSSPEFKGKQLILTADDFKLPLFFVRLDALIHELDEVIIDKYDNINAVSLGILQAPAKSYTPAGRKLKTASSFSGEYGKTAVGLDPIFNALSGRTAMLRKEVEVEKKEFLIRRIEEWFDESYFRDQLKIPAEYVKGFMFYIAENNRFASALNSKNKTSASFLLAQMAVKYKDTIACEAQE